MGNASISKRRIRPSLRCRNSALAITNTGQKQEVATSFSGDLRARNWLSAVDILPNFFYARLSNEGHV